MFNTLYIFNREGNCCYYREWNRKKPAQDLEEDFKLMYGFIFQMKIFCAKTSPSSSADGNFHFYETNTYKLHYFESASMVKFILMTEPQAGEMREFLRKLFEHYTNYVIKNPLFELNAKLDTCTQFVKRVDDEARDWKR